MFKNKEELVATLTAAIVETEQALSALNTHETDRDAAHRKMKNAANSEDYQAAAILKEQVEQYDATLKELNREVTRRVERQSELLEAARIWSFEQPAMNAADEKTLMRVRVVDPLTGLMDTAYYTDTSDTIQLDVNGKHFHSEVWELSDWAGENRLVVDTTVRTVNFGKQ
jgi:hypothetical protein